MGLENRVKLEACLRNLEGRELGHSAGSAKRKPKIEFYDKDRKNGAGALITPAKTYNPAADSVLGKIEPLPEKKELEEVLGKREKKTEEQTEETTADHEEKKDKKKKKAADAEPETEDTGKEAFSRGP